MNSEANIKSRIEMVGGTAEQAGRQVSVVVSACNEAAHVAQELQAIRDVMSQSGWTFEILLVDDGSTDGTAEAPPPPTCGCCGDPESGVTVRP